MVKIRHSDQSNLAFLERRREARSSPSASVCQHGSWPIPTREIQSLHQSSRVCKCGRTWVYKYEALAEIRGLPTQKFHMIGWEKHQNISQAGQACQMPQVCGCSRDSSCFSDGYSIRTLQKFDTQGALNTWRRDETHTRMLCMFCQVTYDITSVNLSFEGTRWFSGLPTLQFWSKNPWS